MNSFQEEVYPAREIISSAGKVPKSGKEVHSLEISRMTPFSHGVYTAIKRIPSGKVTTYAAVARAIGRPRAFRALGNALAKNPFKTVPCHRVICSNLSVGGYARGTHMKIKLLRREGVLIKNRKVDPRSVLPSLHALPSRNL